MYMFANSLMVSPIGKNEPKYCPVCFPEGPNGECFTEEYLTRITGLSAETILEFIAQFRAVDEASV